MGEGKDDLGESGERGKIRTSYVISKGKNRWKPGIDEWGWKVGLGDISDFYQNIDLWDTCKISRNKVKGLFHEEYLENVKEIQPYFATFEFPIKDCVI